MNIGLWAAAGHFAGEIDAVRAHPGTATGKGIYVGGKLGQIFTGIALEH